MEFIQVLPSFETSEKQDEFKELEKYFKTKYNYLPSFYVRVPGRVNLIGEHIDYCGFAVFPMAIEQDIVVAVGIGNDEILNLSNKESGLYSDFSCSLDALEIGQSPPVWFHYFMCGVKGICEEYNIASKGMDVVVSGKIPPSSGLSSSSALVCAAALATACANRISMTKMEIADLCARSERYIGTQGGGMDQAIAFLAEPGSAKLIEFNPLKATSVKLPQGATFVVANSCVAMNKAATSHFNTRVVECRLAAKVLAKTLGLDFEKVHKLGDIPSLLGRPVSDMVNSVKELLHEEPYTLSEISRIIGMSENEVESLYCSKNTQDLKKFKLYQRSMHVYEEAARVILFKDICETGSDNALNELGKLMNDSHRSCRDLYECSHHQLDELVALALSSGAIGSRLTGAGWGGCCVSLVPSDKAANFISDLKQKFYQKLDKTKSAKPCIFVTQPGGGAVVYKV